MCLLLPEEQQQEEEETRFWHQEGLLQGKGSGPN